jgi:hypothetical protein
MSAGWTQLSHHTNV